MTNEFIYTVPLLVRNQKLRCLSIQRLHAELQESIDASDSLRAIRIAADLGQALSDAESTNVLNCFIQTETVVGPEELWVLISLTTSDEMQLLAVLSVVGTATMAAALKEDLQHPRRPYVQVYVLEEVTRCACKHGLFDMALILMAHLCRRVAYCDAFDVLPQHPRSRFEGRYERCISGDSKAVMYVHVRSTSILFLPLDGSPAHIQTQNGEHFAFPAAAATSFRDPCAWSERKELQFGENEASFTSDWTCPLECSVFERMPMHVPPEMRYRLRVDRELCRTNTYAEFLELLSAATQQQSPPDNGEPKRHRRRR